MAALRRGREHYFRRRVVRRVILFFNPSCSNHSKMVAP
jgi:hypothetical protein